jgi:hypothetical protein
MSGAPGARANVPETVQKDDGPIARIAALGFGSTPALGAPDEILHSALVFMLEAAPYGAHECQAGEGVGGEVAKGTCETGGSGFSSQPCWQKRRKEGGKQETHEAKGRPSTLTRSIVKRMLFNLGALFKPSSSVPTSAPQCGARLGNAHPCLASTSSRQYRMRSSLDSETGSHSPGRLVVVDVDAAVVSSRARAASCALLRRAELSLPGAGEGANARAGGGMGLLLRAIGSASRHTASPPALVGAESGTPAEEGAEEEEASASITSRSTPNKAQESHRSASRAVMCERGAWNQSANSWRWAEHKGE